MEISLAFSPCPNDTFIFDALVHQKIDTEGLEFKVFLEDVETLNEHSLQKKHLITKISYGVYPAVADEYKILNSGSALGRGVGPLLVRNETDKLNTIENVMVALPGINTTAHFLFSHAFPQCVQKQFMRYDAIAPFVQDNKGWGVIIHENRFTYEQIGLVKIVDLGQFWEERTGLPIPLGGIVIDRGIDVSLQRSIDKLIANSIAYAYEQYPQLSEFIHCHAQEMSEEVMRQHIDLYVNEYSRNLGIDGRSAVLAMLNHLDPAIRKDIFIEGKDD